MFIVNLVTQRVQVKLTTTAELIRLSRYFKCFNYYYYFTFSFTLIRSYFKTNFEKISQRLRDNVLTSGPEVANFFSITRSSWQISIQGGKWEGLDNKRKQKQLTPVSKYYDQNRPFYSTWAYIREKTNTHA